MQERGGHQGVNTAHGNRESLAFITVLYCFMVERKKFWPTSLLNRSSVTPKGFPDSSVGKESTCSTGDPGLIPGSWRSAGEGIGYPLQYSWAFLVAQVVKNSPAMWETWVRSLGWEDPLGKGKATHSIFWPGEFHGLYDPWDRKESDRTEWLTLLHIKFAILIIFKWNIQWHFVHLLCCTTITAAQLQKLQIPNENVPI